MTNPNDTPFEARIRDLFRERLESRRGDLVMTDFLITEAVRGAEIAELEDGRIRTRLATVSFGPDLMEPVDAELRHAARAAQEERRSAGGEPT